jgi:hypothetical protein
VGEGGGEEMKKMNTTLDGPIDTPETIDKEWQNNNGQVSESEEKCMRLSSTFQREI